MNKKFFLKYFFIFTLLLINIFSFVFAAPPVNPPASTNTDYMSSFNSTVGSFGKLIQNVNTNIGGNIVLLLTSAAFILFLWGLVRFIFDRANGKDQDLEKDKKAMGWGLAALFVLISVWGIIKMFQGFLGIQNSGNINLPKICTNGNCDTSSGSTSSSGGIKTNGNFDNKQQKLQGSTFDSEYTIDSIKSWNLPLKEGVNENEDDVAQLQQFLKEHNFASYLGTTGPNHDGVDGVFGPNTTIALKAFQKANALAQDGVVGGSTRAVILYRYLNASPSSDPYDVSTWPTNIGLGSKGPAVIAMQQFLLNNNCYLSTAKNKVADGVFGQDTLDAVHNYQNQNYLKEDGIVGPSTRAVILSDETYRCQ